MQREPRNDPLTPTLSPKMGEREQQSSFSRWEKDRMRGVDAL
jgi:hypothetical protein